MKNKDHENAIICIENDLKSKYWRTYFKYKIDGNNLWVTWEDGPNTNLVTWVSKVNSAFEWINDLTHPAGGYILQKKFTDNQFRFDHIFFKRIISDNSINDWINEYKDGISTTGEHWAVTNRLDEYEWRRIAEAQLSMMDII